MRVVYCVTADYLEKIKPSIRSLREHNPKVDITIVTETDTTDIDANVIDIRGQEWFPPGSINYKNPFTYIGLLKVCYQSILPYDKVIHLDADTIVADKLADMWNTDLKDKWFGMVQEYRGHYKISGFSKYYNAGVMILNLKQLRKDGIQDDMVKYLNSTAQPWCEQDAFNFYGMKENKIVDLDVRFNENVMTGFTDSPAIVHYCSIGDWWDNRNMSRWEYLSHYK